MKIIVSDFDGTFYSNNYLENISLINKFVEKGNMFIIATGRGINNLRRDIEKYNIKYSFLICSDGATIYNSNNVNLYTCYINSETVCNICNMLENDSNITFTLLENDNIASASLSSSISAYFKNRKVAKKQVKEIVEKYQDVYAYLSKNYINIRDNKTSKSSAIKFLEKKYQLNKDDIFVIGDAINDIEMSKDYTSFTFHNSDKKLKKVCKYIVNNFKEAIEIISKK